MVLLITPARTTADVAEVRRLVVGFLAWLDIRYPDHRAQIAAYFKAQGLEHQLDNLLTLFCPPTAECLLAWLDNRAVGVVMLKPQTAERCEMNRLFVDDAARGHGVGRALVAGIVESAHALGYRQMVLSAGFLHHEARALYTRTGFVEDTSLADTGAGDMEVRMIRNL